MDNIFEILTVHIHEKQELPLTVIMKFPASEQIGTILLLFLM